MKKFKPKTLREINECNNQYWQERNTLANKIIDEIGVKLRADEIAPIFIASQASIDSMFKGIFFKPGREEGEMTNLTKYIRQLVVDNPNLSTKELACVADNSIISGICDRTFANKVSAARKAKNLPKLKSIHPKSKK